jgi:hypothetical protein
MGLSALLGREPEDRRALEFYPKASRLAIVDRFFSSAEFLANGTVCPRRRRYMVELDNSLRF